MINDNKKNNIIFNNYKSEKSIYNNNDHKIEDKFDINFIEISTSYIYCTK